MRLACLIRTVGCVVLCEECYIVIVACVVGESSLESGERKDGVVA